MHHAGRHADGSASIPAIQSLCSTPPYRRAQHPADRFFRQLLSRIRKRRQWYFTAGSFRVRHACCNSHAGRCGLVERGKRKRGFSLRSTKTTAREVTLLKYNFQFFLNFPSSIREEINDFFMRNQRKRFRANIFFILLGCTGMRGQPTPSLDSTRIHLFPVAYVPASFPVNFDLSTCGIYQFVAFYDTSHRMTLAKRLLTDSTWEYQPLDSKVEWDSHNYIVLAVDDDGIIHLAGNMHSSPLIYFRSAHPFDIHSMQALHAMTGKEEDTTTYPQFLRGARNELLFHYRYGRSGSGYEVFNVWSSTSHTWKRLLESPLTDGFGRMNAYMEGPLLGPDHWYHLLWMWRNTPDCATNHTLSYARSKDILQWESVRGEPVHLPITIKDSSLSVDTTCVNGGLINIGMKIGFDSENKVVLGYHKYDSDGNTQLFLARFRQGEWMRKQVTRWNYRWNFHGCGTIENDLLIDPPLPSVQQGVLIFGFHHVKYGNGQVLVH